MPVYYSPHKKTLAGNGRGVPHESGVKMLIRATDRWPSGTLTAAPLCRLPTMRAQRSGDSWPGEIAMISPATAQHLAHENMVRIINFESI